ncbi:MAG: GMC oxidoreductase [Candidatus Bathyarchaeia archaeon]
MAECRESSRLLRFSHQDWPVRIGEVVNTDLETRIRSLYVCDTSIIPEPWGLPPVLTVLAFGKRLGVAPMRSEGSR